MKLCHAAALGLFVLIGCAAPLLGRGGPSGPTWLLMASPLTADGAADKDAPLSKWTPSMAYATQADCQAEIANAKSTWEAQNGQLSIAQTPYQRNALKILNGRCVVSNDPRLGSEVRTPRPSN